MKIVFITPHLSTGGLPQFLLKKIQVLNDTFDIYCIEWENITGGQLVVQRNQIEQILKEKLITLPDNKAEVISILDRINPDVVHFEEFAETFVPSELLLTIYKKPFKITETTHGTLFDKESKSVKSDKTLFVSKGNVEQYFHQTNDFELIEYPTKSVEVRNYFLRELGLDPNKFHVLNVGLFNANKNQGEVFEYAKRFGDNVQFHFVGSQAGNFRDYWEPLIRNIPSNCKVWGERNDVFKFYAFADLFLYTSKLENRPLSVLDALANNVPVVMYNLPNYGDEFVKSGAIFLTNDFVENLALLRRIIPDTDVVVDLLEPEPILVQGDTTRIKLVHLLTDMFAEREQRSIRDLSKLEDYGFDYEMFVNEPYTDLPPAETCAYPEIISMEPGGKLTPGHYGCYLAHRDGLLKAIKENAYDFIMICEADCGYTNVKDFLREVEIAKQALLKENASIYYLVHNHGEHIIENKGDYSSCVFVIAAHCYLIHRSHFEFWKKLYAEKPWNVTDLFFGNNLRETTVLATNNIVTKQYPGYSLLDKIEHETERV